MKLGVIISRFQIDELHAGHLSFIEHVKSQNNRVLFILGDATVYFTSKNHMPVLARIAMLQDTYPNEEYDSVKDIDNDMIWSARIDLCINKYKDTYNDITIYGSRDSFLHHYYGEYKTAYFEPIVEDSATARRNIIKKEILSSKDFRHGIIYAVENRFPVAFPTVDVAVTRVVDQNIQVLLGRRPQYIDRWIFIGGFVDPTDNSKEEAAIRELSEEVDGVVVSNPRYVGSARMDDPRYRGTYDSVMTTLYEVELLSGTPKPATDKNGITELAEVKWVNLRKLDEHISRIHAPLAKILMEQYEFSSKTI